MAAEVIDVIARHAQNASDRRRRANGTHADERPAEPARGSMPPLTVVAHQRPEIEGGT